MLNIEDLIRAVISLFIVVDPIGLIPLITSLMSNLTEEQSKKVLKSTFYTASSLLFVFALLGKELLNIFGVSISNFSIA